MTYTRVIPRDLFNEGDLLKCLGRLSIVLENHAGHDARLRHRHDTGPFNIDQDPSDGSISCENVLLKVGSQNVHLFRPLNSRTPWPLWARFDVEDVEVFDQAGSMTDEFRDLIGGKP